MMTVSLIGVDGVGKTTVARRIESDFPLPIKYLYMGANVKASNYTLPTTRWWRTRRQVSMSPGAAARKPRSGTVHRLRKAVGFVNRLAEELYRAGVVARYRKRGYVVLLDRHFSLDYYHEDHGVAAKRRPLKRRAQGFFRRYIHRLPELVICLDLAGHAAYARKGEFSPEILDTRRRQYLELRSIVPGFAVVDADRELDKVVADVRNLILRFCERVRDDQTAR